MNDRGQPETALEHFKRMARELLVLLRMATGAPTASLHWVNRTRRQFVLESADSVVSHTSFSDRVPMADSYLRGFDMLARPAVLTVGVDVPHQALSHYSDGCPISCLTVIPLIHNDETVALAVLEGDDPDVLLLKSAAIASYSSAMAHLLHTFLELSDYASDEDQWAAYEERLRSWPNRSDVPDTLDTLLDQMAALVPEGSVSILARVFDRWCVVLNHERASAAPPLGTVMDEQSVAFHALQSGLPEYATHLGASPKRVARSEPPIKGATLAIPLLMHDRRQAVVVVTVENMRFFKESVRHKLVNLVRVAGLRLTSGTTEFLNGQDMLAQDQSGVVPGMMDKAMTREFRRGQATVGLATIRDVSSLRARLRMDEMKAVQRSVQAALNPARYGYAGLCGPHADFISLVLFTGTSEDLARYTAAIRDGVSRIPGHALVVEHAFLTVENPRTDPYDVKRSVRLALDAAVKSAR
jgi:hypothetical protein